LKSISTPSIGLSSMVHVVTLGLGLRPRQGLVRLQAKKEAWESRCMLWECRKVRGNEPSHFKGNFHFGSLSPSEFLNFQRAIAGVKTQWIKELFISLKISWDLNV
jgi:hypothetical protein